MSDGLKQCLVRWQYISRGDRGRVALSILGALRGGVAAAFVSASVEAGAGKYGNLFPMAVFLISCQFAGMCISLLAAGKTWCPKTCFRRR
jgi:hypothetical protein